MTRFKVRNDALVPGFFNMMDRFMHDDFNWAHKTQQPAVNITEMEDAFHLEMVAPGLKKSDFKIAMDKNMLTVSYEKSSEVEEQKGKSIRKEFHFNSFSRTFTLSEQLNKEAIKAKYEDGILNIQIPKMEEAKTEVKTVEIL
jgi:HSP20 family protein